MSQPLISPTFLFRFSAPCRYLPKRWGPAGVVLDKSYQLMSFSELDEQPVFADLRVGWNQEGLAFALSVTGKRQTPWCRESRIAESDGMTLWIDTRDTHNIHRASRFCHSFTFLPCGGGRDLKQPLADQMLIHRARENAKPIRPDVLQVLSDVRKDGYVMQAFLPTSALTGYQPEEYPRLGFTYLVADRELGEQTFTVGSEYSYESDPSVWGTLELVK